jgi:hypothetical protein
MRRRQRTVNGVKLPGEVIAMKIPRRFLWVALTLAGACFTADFVMAQSLEPSNDPSPGMRQLPPVPGGGPDPYSKYRMTPQDLRALREQVRLDVR